VSDQSDAMPGPASQAFLEITEVLSLDLRRYRAGGYATDDETDATIATLMADLDDAGLRWLRAAFHFGLEHTVEALVQRGVPREQQAAVRGSEDPIETFDGVTAANRIAYLTDGLRQIADNARGLRVDGTALAKSVEDFLEALPQADAPTTLPTQAAEADAPQEDG
jgi:hypothetical protein